MKKKGFLTLVAAQALLVSSFANANMLFTNFSNDICDTVNGKWTGSGEVSVGIIKCKYNGTAVISGTPDNVSLDVTLDKTSGICPAHEEVQLTNGTCHQGVFAIHTPGVAMLDGTLNAAGTQANVTGNVTFTLGSEKVTANVDSMVLNKQ